MPGCFATWRTETGDEHAAEPNDGSQYDDHDAVHAIAKWAEGEDSEAQRHHDHRSAADYGLPRYRRRRRFRFDDHFDRAYDRATGQGGSGEVVRHENESHEIE